MTKKRRILVRFKTTPDIDSLKKDIAMLGKKVLEIKDPKERAKAAGKLLKIIDTIETIEDPKKLQKMIKDIEAYRRLNNL